MRTKVMFAALSVLLLVAGVGDSGPVTGRIRVSHKVRLEPGELLELENRFKANERACVIVEGDHDPVQELGITILDENKREVTRDEGGDILAVFWYPQREGKYYLQIKMLQEYKVYNDLKLVIK